MKPKGRKIAYVLVAIWLLSTALIIFLYWPLISNEISYYFGKKDNSITTPSPVASQTKDDRPKYDVPNKISIPKIGVDAPWIEAKTIEEKDVIEALKSGVAHYPNTPNPGEAGNVFVTGHSSNYNWIKSDYNYVFSLLNKLVVGDKIYAYRDGYLYIYEVTENIVVKPKEVSVMGPTGESIITIMTCDPPGTNWKRRIVRARQIDPDPATNKQIEYMPIIPEELVGN